MAYKPEYIQMDILAYRPVYNQRIWSIVGSRPVLWNVTPKVSETAYDGSDTTLCKNTFMKSTGMRRPHMHRNTTTTMISQQ